MFLRQESIRTSYPRGYRSRESHDRETAAVKSDGKRPVDSVRGKMIAGDSVHLASEPVETDGRELLSP